MYPKWYTVTTFSIYLLQFREKYGILYGMKKQLMKRRLLHYGYSYPR